MRRALLGVAALGSLLMVGAACGSDDDVDTSIPSVDSVLDTIAPEDSAGPVDSSVTGDTMTPVNPADTSVTGNSTMTSSSTMTSDTASSATVAP